RSEPKERRTAKPRHIGRSWNIFSPCRKRGSSPENTLQASVRAGWRWLDSAIRIPVRVMSITYLEAIREAQARALAEDPRVYIYGQDVGAFGGAFKATKNLAQQFPARVFDAPISEDAMVGAGIGAAI